jgi:hypothetical protein
MSTLNDPKKAKAKPFKIPPKLKNIVTTDIPTPDPELVRQDLATLKQEFKSSKFESYIDIYKGTHAMLKHIYYYQKYLEPGQNSITREPVSFFYGRVSMITGVRQTGAVPGHQKTNR